jgi:hypothetical protein
MRVIFAIAITLLFQSSTVLGYDEEACTKCVQEKIDARWKLRTECLAKGGTGKSCEGRTLGATCCHCWDGPEKDPSCWKVACDAECLWTWQCRNVCE